MFGNRSAAAAPATVRGRRTVIEYVRVFKSSWNRAAKIDEAPLVAFGPSDVSMRRQANSIALGPMRVIELGSTRTSPGKSGQRAWPPR
jgi:hypothetical protein